jgi:hypothetical protein
MQIVFLNFLRKIAIFSWQGAKIWQMRGGKEG